MPGSQVVTPPVVHTPQEIQKRLEELQNQAKQDFLKASSTRGASWDETMKQEVNENLVTLKRLENTSRTTSPNKNITERQVYKQKTQEALQALEAQRLKSSSTLGN